MTWLRKRCGWCHRWRWCGRVIVGEAQSAWLCVDCDATEFWMGEGDD